MTINFTYNNHEEARALTSVAEQKLQTLTKFIDENQSVVCDAEFDKVAANQNGVVFHFAVNLEIEGELYRADATEESFEAAVDEVRAELDKKLRRTKGKKESLSKKAGRALKGMLHR